MKTIKELVDFFEKNKSSIKSSWNETETRIELINPLFECLGWDVNNNQKLADPFKEVKHEASLKIGTNLKAPDYSFNYGKPLFYLEAKKPGIDIKNDINPSFQLRRYGWTAKMPISILTDFEELAIYDCRIKPNANDSSGVARVKYYTYDQYIEKWDEIYSFISKEAVLRGSLNDYETKQIKGTASIDDDFLDSIENWRTLLAENIARRNKNLTEAELNFSVQMIIDRIIFLRICEDRGIENYGELKNITHNENIYSNLIKIFNRADDKYNSGLFHFKNETNRDESPDQITPKLNIDDIVLKDIIKNLYYPNCPYELSVISSDVLGNVYERFLGKVITLSNTHRARIDFKPEVKKAGGVYYTPDYIVEYIVKNTIGEIIKDKTPAQVEKIKILDPACGSGSFLIAAYQYLLDWHLNYYITNEPENWKKGNNPKIFDSKNGVQLTLKERKKILLNNIFGVDIDKNAVEVTKLSLLLKVLEYEGQEVQQRELFQERILPDLHLNIKCGNSLIGSEILNNNDEIGLVELQKINPFDWAQEFSDILSNGGFDVIIGNPPYLKEYTDTTQFHLVRESNLNRYYEGKMDLWYLFACRSIDLLKENGYHSFIATNNWITNAGASILRNKILLETSIQKFIDFSDFKVFQTASIQTMIYVITKSSKKANHSINYIKVLDKNISPNDLKDFILNNNQNYKKSFEYFKTSLSRNEYKDKTFTFVNSIYSDILNRIKNDKAYFLNNNDVAQGIVPPQDFVIASHLAILKNDSIKKGDGIFVISESEFKALNLSKAEETIVKPYYTTNELQRYYGNPDNKYFVIYTDKEARENIKKYPNIKAHLDKFKKIITSDFKPYGLHRARDKKFFEGEKIISLRKTSVPTFTFTDFPCYVSQTYFVIKPENKNLKYLTGLLNSKVVHFWLYYKGKKQGDQLQIDKAPLLEIPLMDANNKNDEYIVVKSVDKIINLLKTKSSVKTDQEKKLIDMQIDVEEKRINEIFYRIYGLSEDDIRVIEESLK